MSVSVRIKQSCTEVIQFVKLNNNYYSMIKDDKNRFRYYLNLYYFQPVSGTFIFSKHYTEDSVLLLWQNNFSLHALYFTINYFNII